MQALLIPFIVGGPIVLGLGIGLWLQKKLAKTDQVIKLPSAFPEK